MRAGIEIEDTFKLEAYTGLFRATLLNVGIKFKFDHLTCATCLGSVILRTAAELPIAEYVEAASIVVDGVANGRRLQSKEGIVPTTSKPTLSASLAKYFLELHALGFDTHTMDTPPLTAGSGAVVGHQTLQAAIASAPYPSELTRRQSTLRHLQRAAEK